MQHSLRRGPYFEACFEGIKDDGEVKTNPRKVKGINRLQDASSASGEEELVVQSQRLRVHLRLVVCFLTQLRQWVPKSNVFDVYLLQIFDDMHTRRWFIRGIIFHPTHLQQKFEDTHFLLENKWKPLLLVSIHLHAHLHVWLYLGKKRVNVHVLRSRVFLLFTTFLVYLCNLSFRSYLHDQLNTSSHDQ